MTTREEAQQQIVSEMIRVLARADVVDHTDRSLADAFEEAGHAESGTGAQLQRVGPTGVDPAQDHVDLLQLAQDAHPHAAVSHGQVTAFQQRKAQQRGDEGLVEGGLGVGARAQHHDPRVLDGSRCRVQFASSPKLRPRWLSLPSDQMITDGWFWSRSTIRRIRSSIIGAQSGSSAGLPCQSV